MATTMMARRGIKAKIKMATARKTVGAKNEKQTMRGPNSGKSKNERYTAPCRFPTQKNRKRKDGNNKDGGSNSCWHKFV